MGSGMAEVSALRPITRSTIARTTTCAAIEPNRLLMAIAEAPVAAEVTVAPISGRDVTPANNNRPMVA